MSEANPQLKNAICFEFVRLSRRDRILWYFVVLHNVFMDCRRAIDDNLQWNQTHREIGMILLTTDIILLLLFNCFWLSEWIKELRFGRLKPIQYLWFSKPKVIFQVVRLSMLTLDRLNRFTLINWIFYFACSKLTLHHVKQRNSEEIQVELGLQLKVSCLHSVSTNTSSLETWAKFSPHDFFSLYF